MAITAAVKGKNRVFRSVAPKSVFESALPVISSAVSYKQGDLLCFDTGTHLIRPVAATADAETIVGVARQTIVAGLLPGMAVGTAVDAAVAPAELAGPEYGSVMKMKLKAGDTFHPGDKVYLADGEDCQTVSVTDPGDHFHIGIFQGVQVTAAAGEEGQVLVGCRYGLAGLQF